MASLSHYKRKHFIKKFCKNCRLKTSSRPFCVCKELSTTSIGKWNLKKATYIRYVIAKLSKFSQVSIMISTESSLQRILWKLKRVWEYFPGHFFDKKFYFVRLQILIIITRVCLLLKLFNNICFVFHASAFDDVMIFEYLKVKIWFSRTKRAFKVK